MDTLTKKQREIRQRESRILQLARPMVANGGVSALSMEAIASELSLARATVYNHFPNREEILLALAIQAMEQRLAIFNHAGMMRGQARRRVEAIGLGCELFVDMFPEFFRVEQIIRNDVIWQKTSPERQELLRACESRCMHTVAGVVRDGVAAGDLELPASVQVEDVVFGLWSQVQGSLLIETTSPSLTDLGIRNSRRAMRRNCHFMLDGLAWVPLFDEATYESWRLRVMDDLSAEFARQAEATS